MRGLALHALIASLALLASGCAVPRVQTPVSLRTHFVGGVEERGHAFVEERSVNDHVVRHVALSSGYASHVRVVETDTNVYVAIVQDEESGSHISLRGFDRALHIVGQSELVGSGEPSLAADAKWLAITATKSGPRASTFVHVFDAAHVKELGNIRIGTVQEFGSQLLAIATNELYVASVPPSDERAPLSVDGEASLPSLSVYTFELPTLRASGRVQTKLDAHESCELRATTQGIAIRGGDQRVVIRR